MSRHSTREVLRRLGVDAKLRAKRWWALCPNAAEHEGKVDRNPSWMIRDDAHRRSGQHYCFTCKFGGGLLSLVEKVKGFEPEDAKEWLRDVSVVPEEPVAAVRVEVMRDRSLVVPREVCFDPLQRWLTPFRDYAIERGIEPWQVERWGVGYALEGRLAMRVVFVSRDGHSIPRNFTGRTILDKHREPKRYLNAREEDRPDHGAMFGEEHWPDRRGVVVVTEGAINALAVERALPGASLACLSGSNVHPTHLAKLATFRRVVLLTDSDAAGDDAADDLAALDGFTSVERVRLPQGKDAADLPVEELREHLHAHAHVGAHGDREGGPRGLPRPSSDAP